VVVESQNGAGPWRSIAGLCAGVLGLMGLIGLPLALQYPQDQKIGHNADAIRALRSEAEKFRESSDATSRQIRSDALGPVTDLRRELERRLDRLDVSLHEHERSNGHIGTAEKLAAIMEKLVEVETQFRGVGQRIDLELRNLTAELSEVRERKRALEATVTALLERVVRLESGGARSIP